MKGLCIAIAIHGLYDFVVFVEGSFISFIINAIILIAAFKFLYNKINVAILENEINENSKSSNSRIAPKNQEPTATPPVHPLFKKEIENIIIDNFNSHISKINILSAKLPSNPEYFIDNKIDLLNHNVEMINNKVVTIIDKHISYLNSRIDFLNLSNPENLKKKGYSIMKINNKIINNIKMIKEKDLIDIDMYNGEIIAIVEKINRK